MPSANYVASPETVEQTFNARKREVEPPPVLVDFNRHPLANIPSTHWIYIFNTVNREFKRSRPSFSKFDFVIPACPAGKKFILARRFASIITTREERKDTFSMALEGFYGEQLAQDLINPQNMSGNMWATVDPASEGAYGNFGGSDDLGRRGVFWTTEVYCQSCGKKAYSIQDDLLTKQTPNGPVEYCRKCDKPFEARPSDEELRKSNQLLLRFCQSRIEAATLIAADPRSPEKIGPEDHWCADYLQLSPAWHTHMAIPEICEVCGGTIKGDPVFHKNSELDFICMRKGQESWKKAVEVGLKTKEQVPEEHRWFSMEETKKGK